MMERKPPPPLLIVTLLLLSYIGSGRGGSTTTTSSHSPTPSPNPSPAAPAPTPPTADSSPTSSTLDPKQLSALQSIGLPTARDPCTQPSPHDNATACDSAAPFRHLISLRLANCSPDIDLSPTALRALSTLRSLSFLSCPIPPPKPLPSPLAASLRSFSCVTSLRRLTGVWLSRLHNLTALTVLDVPIVASGPLIVISSMPNLRSLTISRTNLSGALPHHWRPLGLSRIDLSANRLRGPIPGSISLLGSLESLNLSSNALTGPLPDSIGDLVSLKNVSFSNNSLSGPIPDSLSGLSALAHLDLSWNQFNGSIPRFLSEMKGLGYLNLQGNNFQGVIPFNGTFIKRLEVFKVGGNSNLCYNRTLLSSKLAPGVAPCDRYGLPVSPPPERSTGSESSDGSGDDGSSDNGGGGSEKGGGGHHGPSKLVLGVAIALACLVFLVSFIVCLSKVCG